MNKLFFILVEPQMGENIGAAARIISNFGFSNLRIVSPRDGWPNPKAEQMSAHGIDVIKSVKIFDSLEEAISDLHFLIAATASSRHMNKPSNLPRKAAYKASNALLNKEIVGLMFGRENNGLTNQEISLADYIVTIPTSSSNPSLNIAQAVAILAYELSLCLSLKDDISRDNCNNAEKASKGEVEYFMSSLDLFLSESNFFQVASKKAKMMINIQNMVTRMQPSKQDIQTLQGITKALALFYPNKKTNN